ncbi:MAG: VOC family protein [Lentisphaerae bacterium]|nr:VOC family protein [Lentisphaerota bacterium]
MIKGLEHTALSVSDIDRSVAFYCENFQMTVDRSMECGADTLLGKVTGMKGCVARIVHLRKGSAMIELFEYKFPQGRDIPGDFKQADHGFTHLGFSSDDVRADYRTLLGRGVRFISEPVEFRPSVWVVYFYGPDGEVCELRQS